MIVIFGASGHAKEIGFILRSSGEAINYFVTDDTSVDAINNVPVINEAAFFEIALRLLERVKIFIAVGDCDLRKKICEKIMAAKINYEFPNLFHNTVVRDIIGNYITVGEGNVFFPGVVLTTDIVIGNHNHFNCNASISHDCSLGNFNTISPGVCIAGKVSIGNGNFFGTNATVINNIFLGSNLLIGAGATVTRNLSNTGTYVGTPAKRIK